MNMIDFKHANIHVLTEQCPVIDERVVYIKEMTGDLTQEA